MSKLKHFREGAHFCGAGGSACQQIFHGITIRGGLKLLRFATF
jgi:hypothetical protein